MVAKPLQTTGSPTRVGRFIVPCVVIAALLLATRLPGAVAATTAEAGGIAFEQYCLACHGPDARGIANLGVDLVASAFVRGIDPAGLVAFLKAGRLADDPASVTGRPMPGFAWVSDGELESIAAFLKSLD